MVLSFLVLYLTRERGFSAEQAGFILFLYGAGAIVCARRSPAGSRTGGAPCRSCGRRSSSRASCCSSIRWRARRPAIVAVTIALAMLTEAFRPAAMSFFGETVEPARRKSAFAVYRLAINLGMAIGPAIGGVLATISFRYLFFVDGATSLAAGLVLAAVDASAPARRARVPPPSLDDGDAPAPLDRRARGSALPVLSRGGRCRSRSSSSSTSPRCRSSSSTTSASPPRTFGLLFSLNCLLIVVLEIPLNAATAHWSAPAHARPRARSSRARASARWPSRATSGRWP